MKDNRTFGRMLREMNAAETLEVVLSEAYWTEVKSK
jgi:hypothetical protein